MSTPAPAKTLPLSREYRKDLLAEIRAVPAWDWLSRMDALGLPGGEVSSSFCLMGDDLGAIDDEIEDNIELSEDAVAELLGTCVYDIDFPDGREFYVSLADLLVSQVKGDVLELRSASRDGDKLVAKPGRSLLLQGYQKASA